MIRNVLFIFFALLIVGLGALYLSRISPEREDQLPVFGNMEITEVDISFKLPGKVEKRLVDEGDIVQKGQLIAQLELNELVNERKARLAKVAGAEASYNEIESGSLPSEIVQSGARLEQAKADFNRIKEDYERQEALLRDEVISQKEFDLSRSLFLSAEANLKQAEESYGLLTSTIQEQRIQTAMAQVNEALAGLALADNRLEDATLLSPLEGWVISKNIEAGEVVAAGTPIVTVGNLEDIWFRAYVDETDLGKVKLNQKVQVRTDSYPDKVYEGKITFISKQAEFTPKNVETKKERVKLVYRIKVTLDNSALELRPGMPAEGIILL